MKATWKFKYVGDRLNHSGVYLMYRLMRNNEETPITLRHDSYYDIYTVCYNDDIVDEVHSTKSIADYMTDHWIPYVMENKEELLGDWLIETEIAEEERSVHELLNQTEDI